jgi:hypothetical protein
VRREYLGLLRLVIEGRRGDAWRTYREAAVAALEMVPMVAVHGWIPNLYIM